MVILATEPDAMLSQKKILSYVPLYYSKSLAIPIIVSLSHFDFNLKSPKAERQIAIGNRLVEWFFPWNDLTSFSSFSSIFSDRFREFLLQFFKTTTFPERQSSSLKIKTKQNIEISEKKKEVYDLYKINVHKKLRGCKDRKWRLLSCRNSATMF